MSQLEYCVIVAWTLCLFLPPSLPPSLPPLTSFIFIIMMCFTPVVVPLLTSLMNTGSFSGEHTTTEDSVSFNIHEMVSSSEEAVIPTCRTRNILLPQVNAIILYTQSMHFYLILNHQELCLLKNHLPTQHCFTTLNS